VAIKAKRYARFSSFSAASWGCDLFGCSNHAMVRTSEKITAKNVIFLCMISHHAMISPHPSGGRLLIRYVLLFCRISEPVVHQLHGFRRVVIPQESCLQCQVIHWCPSLVLFSSLLLLTGVSPGSPSWARPTPILLPSLVCHF
jgi:hypothetical protein